MCAQCNDEEISTREAAEVLAMSHTTFYRHFGDWGQKTCRMLDN